MMFIVLVLAIVIVRFYPHGTPRFLNEKLAAWYGYVMDSAHFRELGSGRLYLSMLLPLGAVFLAVVMLHAANLNFIADLLVLALLVLSFGASDLQARVSRYVEDLKRSDVQAAYHDAAGMGEGRVESAASNWQELHRETLKTVTSSYYECYFPVVFWFVVLGIPGAFAYRLITILLNVADSAEQQRLSRIKFMLDWIPVRLFAIAMAVAGNFSPVINQLRVTATDIRQPVTDLVYGYVVAAIHGKTIPEALDLPLIEVLEFEELPHLMDRTLITWIAVAGAIALL